jgi:hypothetical protein
MLNLTKKLNICIVLCSNKKNPWTLKLERANGKLNINEITYKFLGMLCTLAKGP